MVGGILKLRIDRRIQLLVVRVLVSSGHVVIFTSKDA